MLSEGVPYKWTYLLIVQIIIMTGYYYSQITDMTYTSTAEVMLYYIMST